MMLASETAKSSEGFADRRISRLSTTSDVPGSQSAQPQSSTFMGKPLAELRGDQETPEAGQTIADFVVLPKRSWFHHTPTIDELLCWTKVRRGR